MDSNIKITPTSSTTTTGTMARSISTQPSSLSSEKSRYGFRQQLKRFVGWGSSKPKKPLLAPLTTNTQNSHLDPPPPLTGSTLVLDSPSEMSFVSAPSTPLPPTPCTPQSTIKSRLDLPVKLEPTLSRRTSEITASEVAMSVISASKSRLSTVSSLSTCSVTTEEITAQEKVYISDSEDDDSDDGEDAISAKGEVVQENTESPTDMTEKENTETVSTIQEMTDDTSLVAEVEEEVKCVVQDTTIEKDQLETPMPPPVQTGGEFNDIQAQYAMWMNSQPPENASSPFPVSSVTNSQPPTPSIHSPPPKNVLKTKPSITISEKSTPTATMMNSPSNVSSSSSSCASTCSGTTAFTTISTSVKQKELQEPLHPMPSNNEKDLDDLFLLVAHGVEFLKTKESTKWEEEGGYEFHPWNIPHSSFAVKHNKAVKNSPTQVPAELTQNAPGIEQRVIEEKEELDIGENEKEEKLEQGNEEEKTEVAEETEEEAVVSQESLVSVAKRILGAKSEPQNTQQCASNEHQSLDDDELQSFVASHIVF